MTTANGQAPQPGKYEQVAANGAIWKLSHINPGIRKKFAASVEEQALLRVTESKTRLPAAEYAARKQWLNEQIMAGAYDWGFPRDPNGRGRAIELAMANGDGPIMLAQMLLEEYHPTATIEQITDAWNANVEEFNDAMRRALDPNSASPSQSQETGTAKAPGMIQSETA